MGALQPRRPCRAACQSLAGGVGARRDRTRQLISPIASVSTAHRGVARVELRSRRCTRLAKKGGAAVLRGRMPHHGLADTLRRLERHDVDRARTGRRDQARERLVLQEGWEGVAVVRDRGTDTATRETEPFGPGKVPKVTWRDRIGTMTGSGAFCHADRPHRDQSWCDVG